MEKIRVAEDIPLKLVPMTKNGLVGGFREVTGRAKVKIGFFDLNLEGG